MKRGRKPTPTVLRQLRGNPSKRAINHREPQPPPGLPACPRWLDAEGKKVWHEIVPQLKAMRLLARIDKGVIARYCDAWSQWKRNREFLRTNGDCYPIKDDSGRVTYLQPFPQLAQLNRLVQQMTNFESAFGLSPSSRSTIRVNEGGGELDAFEQMRMEAPVIGRIGTAS